MVWKLKHKPKVIEITTSINYEFNKRIKFNQFHQSDLKKRRFRCKTSKLSRAVYVIWQLDAYKHKSTRIKLTQSVAVRDCPCSFRVHKKNRREFNDLLFFDKHFQSFFSFQQYFQLSHSNFSYSLCSLASCAFWTDIISSVFTL